MNSAERCLIRGFLISLGMIVQESVSQCLWSEGLLSTPKRTFEHLESNPSYLLNAKQFGAICQGARRLVLYTLINQTRHFVYNSPGVSA